MSWCAVKCTRIEVNRALVDVGVAPLYDLVHEFDNLRDIPTKVCD